MKLSKWVFRIAGIYGILVLLPLYFTEANPQMVPPPPLTHPEYYYGFAGVALAWQVVFLILSTDPLKYRLLMIPSVLEKFSFGGAVAMLYMAHRVGANMILPALIDTTLGILFVACFLKTAKA